MNRREFLRRYAGMWYQETVVNIGSWGEIKYLYTMRVTNRQGETVYREQYVSE